MSGASESGHLSQPDFVVRTKNTFVDVLVLEEGEPYREGSPLQRHNSMPELPARPSADASGEPAGQVLSALPTQTKSEDFQVEIQLSSSTDDSLTEDDQTNDPASGSVDPINQSAQREMQLAAHRNGTCVPCLFYTRKKDGCRKGDACTHCHFCSPSEARRRRNRQCLERKRDRLRNGEATMTRRND